MSHEVEPKQLLHLVFGGELEDLGGVHFRDVRKLDLVGVYPDNESALADMKRRAEQEAARQPQTEI